MITLQAFSQKQFNQAISGTYIDTKTSELVFIQGLDNQLVMFYQTNPYAQPAKVKVMERLGFSDKRRWLKMQFRQSKYVCEFTFTPDFQRFICKNPDGSKQQFIRKTEVVKRPFAYFLKQFPLLESSQFAAKFDDNKSSKMPLEVAYKYLISQDISFIPIDFDAKTNPQKKLQASKFYLYRDTPQANVFYAQGQFSFYYLNRLQVNSQFHTLLFRVKGWAYMEVGIDMIFVANFTKTGKLIDARAVSYQMLNHINSKIIAQGIIDKNTIKIEETHTLYQGSLNEKRKEIKQPAKIEYVIAPNGKITLKNARFEGINGNFKSYNHPYAYTFYINYYSKDNIQAGGFPDEDCKCYVFRTLKLSSYDAQKGLLLLENKSKEIIKIQFNKANTEFLLTKPNGGTIRFRRDMK